LGFIVPNTWLLINNADDFRREILSWKVKEVIDHGDGVFKDAIVQSSSLVLEKEKSDIRCRAGRFLKGKKVVDHLVDKQAWLKNDYCRIVIETNPVYSQLVERLKFTCEPFGKHSIIIFGIKPYQVGYGVPPQTRQMVDKRIFHDTSKKGEEWKPLLVGSDVNRYSIRFPDDQFIKYGKWLMYPSNETLMLGPKILLRRTSDILRACYDSRGYYCQNSLFIIHSDKINLKFLLGLLNSALFRYLYRLSNPQTGKVFAEVKPSVVKGLPIIKADSDAHTKALQRQVVALVDEMLSLKKAPESKTRIADKIAAIDKEIDQIVYRLYGLTAKEIEAIGGSGS
jgi:hypothetical protein